MSLFVFAICNVCRTDFKSVLTTRTKGYIYSFYNKCNAKIIVGWLYYVILMKQKKLCCKRFNVRSNSY